MTVFFLAIFAYIQFPELLKVSLWFVANMFLYPYSRYAYEGIVDFILGDHWFETKFETFIFTKGITMTLCYMLAVVIAPLGLIHLYFYHTYQLKKAVKEYQFQKSIKEWRDSD